MLEKQSSFSRTLANVGKMGAYYTDLEHCRDIAKMFHFPEGQEVSCLEPSIGNGEAIITVTGAKENSDIKIFGVELNNETACAVKKNPYITDILEADFLNDVFISNNVFSFCFGNPPYLDNVDMSGKRSELLFLEKVGNYLCTGAILVWVIPYRVFSDAGYLRYWHSRYDTLALYRFRNEEYEKFKQIVVVGKKKRFSTMLSASQMKEYQDQVFASDKIPILPDNFPEKIDVPPSPCNRVTVFSKRIFDPDAAKRAMPSLPTDLLRSFDEHMSVKPYSVCSLGHPPIPLKKDSMYLVATSGGGQGLTGSEDDGTLHLQRGNAEIVDEYRIDPSEGQNSSDKMVVTTRTQISMYVVQNDGKIDKLV